MFTNRRLHLIPAIAATGLVLGTVGIVAASTSGPTVPAATTDATDATDATTAPAPTTDGHADSLHAAATATTPATTDFEELAETPAIAPESGIPDSWPAPDTPDDPEPTAPGEPGVESGEDLPDVPPPPPPPPADGPTELGAVPKDPPPPPPIPGPTDLTTFPAGPDPEPIDDFATPVDPTPWDVADDFQVVPLPGYLDDLSSGLTGCQLECVTTALLSSNMANANVQLDATTTVPVHFEVEVSEVDGDWSEYFNNPGYDTEWSTTLEPLQPETTYDLTLIAIDQDGHSKVYEHRFTTVAIIDGFASNGKGCALECLTVGTVDQVADTNTAQVHVESNTPAELQVWFSTSEPTWVDDPAAKPAYGPVYANEHPSTNWTFDVDDLEYDTTYHVVARAHDAHGEHYRIGTFRTGGAPTVDVRVGFEHITVTHDGDKGALNRGEISFSWGFDGASIGTRGEEKMHAGTVHIGSHNYQWFSIDPAGDTIPLITVGAHERDWDGLVEFCSSGTGPGTAPHYLADCDTKTNVATMGGPLTLDQILEFDSCSGYGVHDLPDGARCAAIGTAATGTRDDDYAHFSAVISFVVAD